jgi:tetratricopeptide (TPR) repeat protein
MAEPPAKKTALKKAVAKKVAAKKSAAKKRSTKKAHTSPQALAREMFAMLANQLGPDELILPSDVDALMASLEGPSAYEGMNDAEADRKGDAQQIAFDAMEADSEVEARKLAKRALRLDPDCVDALVLMNDLDASTRKQRVEGLKKAVEVGERVLGAKFIQENKGDFWLLLETRPWMRALDRLATELKEAGLNQDAIGVYVRMLELNPNDNQGVRDPLLGLYLTVGDFKSAGKLLKRYENDALANFAWGRVLERFLAGDRVGAKAALEIARAANRHVELYLTARKPLPEEPPEMYSPGSVEEAVLVLINLSAAWSAHKESVFWLFDELQPDETAPASAKKQLKLVPAKGKRVQ